MPSAPFGKIRHVPTALIAAVYYTSTLSVGVPVSPSVAVELGAQQECEREVQLLMSGECASTERQNKGQRMAEGRKQSRYDLRFKPRP